MMGEEVGLVDHAGDPFRASGPIAATRICVPPCGWTSLRVAARGLEE